MGEGHGCQNRRGWKVRNSKVSTSTQQKFLWLYDDQCSCTAANTTQCSSCLGHHSAICDPRKPCTGHSLFCTREVLRVLQFLEWGSLVLLQDLPWLFARYVRVGSRQ